MNRNKKRKLFFYLLLFLSLVGVIICGVFFITKIYQSNLENFQSNISKGDAAGHRVSGTQRDKKNAETEGEKHFSIIFVGDLMFDRSIRQFAASKGNDFIFENIHDYLVSADLVVANLEGPITPSASVSAGTLPGQGGHFKFTFDPGLAETLPNQNVKLVNLGNNHILNFGNYGLDQTKKYLKEFRVDYFGDAGEKFNESREMAINEVQISFINYNQFSSGSLERTIEEIEKRKGQDRLVIVYTHWGIEYAKTANSEIKKIARSFVDLGADLVIGTHPHVIQDKESYGGKMIYYSLGNFIFDQYFSPETMEGLMVKVACDKEKKCEFEEKKIQMKKNGQTDLSEL